MYDEVTVIKLMIRLIKTSNTGIKSTVWNKETYIPPSATLPLKLYPKCTLFCLLIFLENFFIDLIP
uniref:Uncharacterized protein n=1 Tax=Lepeophtheirus salmonis TaxID=72036 RepID=A0A0K2UQJ8_LEPSM